VAPYRSSHGNEIDVESLQALLTEIQKNVAENLYPMPKFEICQGSKSRVWDAIQWLESGSCDVPTMPALVPQAGI
jgi:hypothetical protein